MKLVLELFSMSRPTASRGETGQFGRVRVWFIANKLTDILMIVWEFYSRVQMNIQGWILRVKMSSHRALLCTRKNLLKSAFYGALILKKIGNIYPYFECLYLRRQAGDLQCFHWACETPLWSQSVNYKLQLHDHVNTYLFAPNTL